MAAPLFNPSCAKLVRIQKKDNEIVQDCDLYIGDAVNNSQWSLNASPYACRVPPEKYNTLAQRNRLYYGSLLRNPTLMENIVQDVQGKVLGDFCDDANYCHGTVIIQVANEQLWERAGHRRRAHFAVGRMFYVYKGQAYPLSHLWSETFHFQGREFTCLESAALFWRANQGEHRHIAIKALERCSTVVEVLELRNQLHEEENVTTRVGWSMKENMLNHHKLLQLKWNQSKDFRRAVRKLEGRIPLEATNNTFWGIGIDLPSLMVLHGSELDENEESCEWFYQLPGQNVTGWFIMAVAIARIMEQDVPWCLNNLLSELRAHWLKSRTYAKAFKALQNNTYKKPLTVSARSRAEHLQRPQRVDIPMPFKGLLYVMKVLREEAELEEDLKSGRPVSPVDPVSWSSLPSPRRRDSV